MPTVDYRPRVESEVGRIQSSSKLTRDDCEGILEYKRDLEIEGISNGRIYKVIIHLRSFAEKLEEVSLVDTSEGDVKDLVRGYRVGTSPSPRSPITSRPSSNSSSG